MQCACAILSSAVCLAQPYPSSSFSTLCHKGKDFRKKKKKKLLNTKFVSNFSTNFVRNISYSKKNLVRYDKKMCSDLHVKYPFFVRF